MIHNVIHNMIVHYGVYNPIQYAKLWSSVIHTVLLNCDSFLYKPSFPLRDESWKLKSKQKVC